MTPITGKGLWVWYASTIVSLYGTAEKAAQAAEAGGFSHILVKVCNGWWPWLPNTSQGKGLLDLIEACHGHGLKVHGWRYTYAQNSVQSEVDSCARAIDAYGQYLSSWIEDAETEYKTSNGPAHAAGLLPAVKGVIGDLPLGFTSYRYPELHAAFPWAVFGEYCDFTLPQVYWIKAHNPGAQITETIRQYAANADLKKFVPMPLAGSAYKSGTWLPSASEMTEFSETAKANGCPAINWWTWDNLIKVGLWDLASGQDWPPGQSSHRKAWSDLTDAEKDTVLLQTAQAAGVVAADGTVEVGDEP